MIPSDLPFLLNAFYDALFGLRTAQPGLANVSLAWVIQHSSGQLSLMPPTEQHQFLPTIQAMLMAKQRRDDITLADLLQTTIPAIYARIGLDPSLFAQEDPKPLLALDEAFQAGDDCTPIIDIIRTSHRSDYAAAAGMHEYPGIFLLIRGHFEQAESILLEDLRTGRLSPLGRYALAFAQASRYRFDQSYELMEAAYAGIPDAHDGFARIGACYAHLGKWHKALEVSKRDEAGSSLSAKWRVELARQYTHCGQLGKARLLIAAAYETNRDFRCGYAALASACAHRGDLQDALNLIKEEQQLDRAQVSEKLTEAEIRTRLSHWEQAIVCVDELYEKDSQARDAYTHVGWLGYLQGKGVTFFEKMTNRDVAAKRNGQEHLIYHVVLEISAGRFDNAYQLMETYEADFAKAKDWYANVGWLLVFRHHQPALGAAIMRCDFSSAKLCHKWHPTFTLALALGARVAEAREHLDALRRDAHPEDIIHIGHPGAPDAILEFQRYSTLVESLLVDSAKSDIDIAAKLKALSTSGTTVSTCNL
jgi:hypothetical protein